MLNTWDNSYRLLTNTISFYLLKYLEMWVLAREGCFRMILTLGTEIHEMGNLGFLDERYWEFQVNLEKSLKIHLCLVTSLHHPSDGLQLICRLCPMFRFFQPWSTKVRQVLSCLDRKWIPWVRSTKNYLKKSMQMGPWWKAKIGFRNNYQRAEHSVSQSVSQDWSNSSDIQGSAEKVNNQQLKCA